MQAAARPGLKCQRNRLLVETGTKALLSAGPVAYAKRAVGNYSKDNDRYV